jgi:hypothetical protein
MSHTVLFVCHTVPVCVVQACSGRLRGIQDYLWGCDFRGTASWLFLTCLSPLFGVAAVCGWCVHACSHLLVDSLWGVVGCGGL